MTINVTPIPRVIDLAVPAFTLGTANSAGAAQTAVSSNSTLLAFDATLPAAIGTAAVGSATTAARRDHVHSATHAALGSVSTSQHHVKYTNAEALAAAGLQVHLINATRTAAASTGDVAYTGAGFEPVGCIAINQGTTTNDSMCIGVSDDQAAVSDLMASVMAGALVLGRNTNSIIKAEDTTRSHSQRCDVTSYDADGITLGWVKGSNGEACNFVLMLIGQ